MKNILVTGATGFIGKQLVPYLLQQQLKVRVLIRDRQKAATLPHGVEIFIGDLTERNSLTGACREIDTVFHLGGYAHAWTENEFSFADQHRAVNLQGTQNIMAEALLARVNTFIYFSTVKAVADCHDCIDEKWDNPPQSPYGIAKRQAEEVVLAAQHNGMHVCVLRPALVYGPGWKGNLANMLRAIDRGLFLPLPETLNRRSMISVDDLCHAALLSATQTVANGKIYFVTDGIAYSTRQLYLLMSKALNKSVPQWHIPLCLFQWLAWIGDRCEKITRRRFIFNTETFSKLFGSAHYDSTRIKQGLNFTPRYDLKCMLPRIIETYRNQQVN